MMIGVILYFSRGFFGMFLPNPETGANMETAQRLGIIDISPTPTYVQVVPGINVTSPAQPTYTPYPTLTPAPTYTPQVDWLRGSPTPTRNAFEPHQINFVFSYYYPDLVSKMDEDPSMAVNCHPDNWIYNPQNTKVIGCKDTTASGEPWSRYLMDYTDISDIRGGIAVPFHPDTCPRLIDDIIDTTCKPIYPMGSIMVITEPALIAGNYIVIDLCPACGKYIYSHGVLFLDFLAKGLPGGINFWDEVEVIDVIYP